MKILSHGFLVRIALFLGLSPWPLPLFGQALPVGEPPAVSIPSQPADKKREPIRFQFTLRPKSFQANPEMEFSIITEMTEAGKKLPPVSPAEPAYYVLQPSGFRQSWGEYSFKKTLTGDDLKDLLVKSLNGNGYHPVPAGPLRPSLLIVYTWGTFFNPDPLPGVIPDPIEEAYTHEAAFLQRARLVGGEKFVKEVQYWMLLGPIWLKHFMRSDPKNNFLVDQSAGDMYYVVASAYDYAAAAANQRRLLWRTRMTVNAYGLNQTQTFPTVITAASPFFGKDMTEPEVIYKHLLEGKVEVGTPRVVDDKNPTAK